MLYFIEEVELLVEPMVVELLSEVFYVYDNNFTPLVTNCSCSLNFIQ